MRLAMVPWFFMPSRGERMPTQDAREPWPPRVHLVTAGPQRAAARRARAYPITPTAFAAQEMRKVMSHAADCAADAASRQRTQRAKGPAGFCWSSTLVMVGVVDATVIAGLVVIDVLRASC